MALDGNPPQVAPLIYEDADVEIRHNPDGDFVIINKHHDTDLHQDIKITPRGGKLILTFHGSRTELIRVGTFMGMPAVLVE